MKVSYLRNSFGLSGGKTPELLRQRIKVLSPEQLVEEGEILVWKIA